MASGDPLDKQTGLDFAAETAKEFSGVKGISALPGLQKGLMEGIGETRERERRGQGLFTTEVTPPLLEEDIEITPREETITGFTPMGEQILKERGAGALQAYAREGLEGLKAFAPSKPGKPTFKLFMNEKGARKYIDITKPEKITKGFQPVLPSGAKEKTKDQQKRDAALLKTIEDIIVKRHGRKPEEFAGMMRQRDPNFEAKKRAWEDKTIEDRQNLMIQYGLAKPEDFEPKPEDIAGPPSPGEAGVAIPPEHQANFNTLRANPNNAGFTDQQLLDALIGQ
jgi:hypothetical protein